MVSDYYNKQMLAKLGYRFDGTKLYDWQVQVYTIIENKRQEVANQRSKAGKRG